MRVYGHQGASMALYWPVEVGWLVLVLQGATIANVWLLFIKEGETKMSSLNCLYKGMPSAIKLHVFFCCCTIWKLFFTTFLVACVEVLHGSLSTKIRPDAPAWLLLAAGTLFTCQMSAAWVSLEVCNLYFHNKKCRNFWYFGICSACSFCSWTLDGAGTFCLVFGNGYGIMSWIVWMWVNPERGNQPLLIVPWCILKSKATSKRVPKQCYYLWG